MKQVEFDIELVKKIQSGEVKGCIKTRSGRTARFMGERVHNIFPLIFTHIEDEYGREEVSTYTIKGLYHGYGACSEMDICIEIETNDEEHQFKPFDKVLVRDVDNEEWSVGIYGYYKSDCDYPHFCAGLTAMRQCIPYVGNESLLGTTDKPKEE